MINKFPKINKKDKEKIMKWLKKEKYSLLSEQFDYLKAGNEEEAKVLNTCAHYVDHLMDIITYHEEE